MFAKRLGRVRYFFLHTSCATVRATVSYCFLLISCIIYGSYSSSLRHFALVGLNEISFVFDELEFLQKEEEAGDECERIQYSAVCVIFGISS